MAIKIEKLGQIGKEARVVTYNARLDAILGMEGKPDSAGIFARPVQLLTALHTR